MSISASAQGRRYGPFTYQVGIEKLREFALAVGGGIPSSGFSFESAPADIQPLYLDEDYARTTRHGTLVAPPTFAVVFNIRPFAAACRDPQNGIDLLRLVHGEQEFEFLEPVKPGDTLTTRGEITEAYSKAGMDFITVVAESHNQHGKLAVRGVYTGVVRPA
jgi:acyl dehydratase